MTLAAPSSPILALFLALFALLPVRAGALEVENWQTVFWEDFEAGFSPGVPHTSGSKWEYSVRHKKTFAQQVSDPLNATNKCLSFSNPQGGGDLWSAQHNYRGRAVRLTFRYLGSPLPPPGSHPLLFDNLGGFFGIGKNGASGSGSFFLAGTWRNYGGSMVTAPFYDTPFTHLLDGVGAWRTYAVVIPADVSSKISPFGLMLEDWKVNCATSIAICNSSLQVGGDALFDDIRIEELVSTCGDTFCQKDYETCEQCPECCEKEASSSPESAGGLIAGIAVGGAVVCAVAVGAVVFVRRKNRLGSDDSADLVPLPGDAHEYDEMPLDFSHASPRGGGNKSVSEIQTPPGLASPGSDYGVALDGANTDTSPDRPPAEYGSMPTPPGDTPEYGSMPTPGGSDANTPEYDGLPLSAASTPPPVEYGGLPVSPVGSGGATPNDEYGTMPSPSPAGGEYGTLSSPSPAPDEYGSMPDIPRDAK
jgi:hypothetical protein